MKTKLPLSNLPIDPNNNLYLLTEQLLKEPFANQNAFFDLSLLQIGQLIEEHRDHLEGSTPTPSESKLVEEQSYLECSKLYCQLLLELEKDDLTDKLNEPLGTLLELPLEIDTPEDPETKPTKTIEPHDFNEIRNKLSTTQAEEYVTIASSLEPPQKGTSTLATQNILNRMRGLGLCLALEEECAAKLKEGLAFLWPEREPAVRCLLNPHTNFFELHPEIVQVLEETVKRHSVWLYKGTFSHHRILESLRYLMAFPLLQGFYPTLLETGLLAFFFGQDIVYRRFPFRNVMKLKELKAEEIIELMFRLSRIHKIKNKITHASSSLESEHMDLLDEDMQRTLTLLGEMRFG